MCNTVMNLIFVYKFNNLSKTVAKLTMGDFAHVDINIHDPDTPTTKLFAYSSYMYNPLLYTGMYENIYNCEHDVALSLTLSDDDAREATKYLNELVQKETKYNYKDLPLCLIPTRMHHMFSDTNPDEVKSVFCSQLVVLLLRQCLSINNETIGLREKLLSINSRCTSPNLLYNCLQPFCERIRVSKLCMGTIEPFITNNVTHQLENDD